MVRSSCLCFVLVLAATMASGQANRYMVFFKDKSGTPYSINQPAAFLSAKAIEKRKRFGITITNDDLPVNPAYVAQVKNTGAKTFFTSKWWNGVLIEAEPALLPTIRNLNAVSSILYVAPGRKLAGGRIKNIKRVDESRIAAAVNYAQLQMIGLDDMHLAGYLGDGVTVAIFDSGFQGVNVSAPFQHLVTTGRLKSVFNFVQNTTNVFSADDHGTGVLSVMAGMTSNYMGGAPRADYHLFQTEDVPSEYKIEEYNWTFAAERADSLGVDVINSSLGYSDFDDPSMDYKTSQLDGNTAVITRAARKAMDRGIVVVVSAGNLGASSWRLITPPADAREIIAVGSISALGTRSNFSSTGATTDGRIKPDVVALGSGTSIILPSGSIGNASGTSFASPLVASFVVGLVQRFPELPVSEVYQAVIRSASQFATPDNFRGYGIPDFTNAAKYILKPPPTEDIDVFPNPVEGDVIKIVLKDPNERVEISIYSTTGALVEQYSPMITWENNPFQYDISRLTAGTYLVSVKTAKAIKTVRLIRQ